MPNEHDSFFIDTSNFCSHSQPLITFVILVMRSVLT